MGNGSHGRKEKTGKEEEEGSPIEDGHCKCEGALCFDPIEDVSSRGGWIYK
jgi:hypothetical protein